MKVREEDIGMMAGAPRGGRLYVKENLIELYGVLPANATFCDRNGSITEARWRQVAAALMCYNVLIRQVNRSANNRPT